MRDLLGSRFQLGIAIVTAWLLHAQTASAQLADFATCPASLSTCSSTTTSCCKKDFAPASGAKAIIIPMDRCHQRVAGSGVESPPGSGPPRLAAGTANLGQGWCQNPIGSADDGVFQVYGLVYRLMQKGIPVYWIVNPTKDPARLTPYQNATSQEYIATDVDLWVLGGGATGAPTESTALTSCPSATCTQPIYRLDSTTLAPVANSYQYQEMPLRGGAFVIAPADRARFDAFWKKTGEFSGLAAKYTFSGIDLYEIDSTARFAYQDFTTASPYTLVDNYAPVAVTINYDPPRIARLGSTSAVATSWLAKANIDDAATNASCTSGAFVPSDAVYCNVPDAQVQSGALVNGAFTWAWIDKWSDNSPCGSTAERAMFDKIREFVTAVPGVRTAGNAFFMESAVGVAEECANRQMLGVNGAGVGLSANNTAINESASQPFIFRYPQNLFAQWGDVPMDFQSGAVTNWTYYGPGIGGYQAALMGAGSTLKRLATREHSAVAGNPLCSGHKASATCDVFANNANADLTDMAAYARYQNNGINGVVFYTGGNQIQNNTAHLRMVLNSLLATPLGTVDQTATSTYEVTRSTPIAAVINNQTAIVQGTYEYVSPQPAIPTMLVASDAAGFRFPYLKGHMRAVSTTNVTTTATDLSAQTAIFDAADRIPNPNYAGCSSPYAGTCRTVFTTIAGGVRPSKVLLQQSNVSTLGPLMASNLTATEWAILVQRILAGHESSPGTFVPKLGGIDRSTVAVIPTSQVSGTARPTMVYFGAADGMLHAVCASVSGPCDQLGRELWAYIPRQLLSSLRYNTAHIDGSPRVVDMFGDFYGTGQKSFRTILMFQTGSGDATANDRAPAMYALDITDPSSPNVLWEYKMADINARGTLELGQGLTVAAGRVSINGANKYLAIAQTNNGGTGGAGSVVTAINIETGAVQWQTGHVYPAARDPSNPNVPSTGIPGGAVGVDRYGTGSLSEVVLGTLYGDIYLLDAATGANKYGTSPLFRFTSDFHPFGAAPTLYSNGNELFAVAGTGGYADPNDSSWASTVTQYVIAVSLSTPIGNTPLNQSSGTPYVPFVFALAAGEKSYSQALVVGGELFFTTDTADVNDAAYGTNGSATGSSYRLSLATGATAGTTVVIAGGAGGLANSGTSLFSSTKNAAQRISDAAGTQGNAVNDQGVAELSRRLWLRSL
ncbi:MAG: hypothetical protein AB7P03_24100 [Kofleriaceae bacterium]